MLRTEADGPGRASFVDIISKEVVMKERFRKRRIRVIRENPVARVLGGSQYRLQVKPSGKAYKRSDNKKSVKGELQDRKDPMAVLPLGSGAIGSFLLCESQG